MKTYDSYKKSGISWIGEIPSHWEVRKIRYCFRERSQKGFPNEPMLCATQSQGVIPQSMYANRVVVVNKDFDKQKLVKVGDFVISLRSFEGGIEYAYYQGIISAAYTILTPRETAYSDYFKLLFKSFNFIQLLQTCVAGIREGQNINYPLLSKHFIPIPPVAEQRRIVEYLSSKTTKIDSYVAERERELRLLDELKRAEVANVVTRGLDPNAPFRTTIIPWLQEIPSHWNEKRAKYLFIRQNRPVRECDDVITCFRDGQVTLRKNRRTEGFTESFKEFGYQGVRKGDLVVHQMDAFAGSTGVSDSDGKSTPVYIVCTPAQPYVYIPYFALVLRYMGLNGFIQSLYRGIRERSSNFSYDVFCKQILPLPPLAEQRAIVEYINGKTARIDALIAELRAEIAYLAEYRQRLIADVVTGQICVAEPQKGEME